MQRANKMKNRDQLKVHLVHFLADENEYVDDSFVVFLNQKRFFNDFKTFTNIIC